MTLNFIAGFIIPWILGLGFIKDRKLLFVFVPITVALSTVINTIGFNYFWFLSPRFRNVSFSALPFDLGLYPIVICSMLYFISSKGTKAAPSIVLTSVFLTVIEWIFKEFNRVTYFNGWNIFWTFISYVVPAVVLYLYYISFFKFFRKSP
ncbi:hypothetical protein PPOLYM_03463 [Paenibacillus polymyxa]|uniref:hypothetical protein n=1 Tax=Paenibacillus polymyxa TaxID=1406 RepID=UPI000D7848CC|nr:hypothetical protein [Paenibacillus polymyxa]VUG07055.1 hypothetical protein PPOLYM_03463 [Paenibacillus polymyxa]